MIRKVILVRETFFGYRSSGDHSIEIGQPPDAIMFQLINPFGALKEAAGKCWDLIQHSVKFDNTHCDTSSAFTRFNSW